MESKLRLGRVCSRSSWSIRAGRRRVRLVRLIAPRNQRAKKPDESHKDYHFLHSVTFADRTRTHNGWFTYRQQSTAPRKRALCESVPNPRANLRNENAAYRFAGYRGV